MVNGCSLLAPAKIEERREDNGFLTRGGGEVRSINNGEDLGDEMGDHPKPEPIDKEERLLEVLQLSGGVGA